MRRRRHKIDFRPVRFPEQKILIFIETEDNITLRNRDPYLGVYILFDEPPRGSLSF